MKLFKKHGILGINARNLLYIKPFNKKKAINLADNKLKTKHFLSARGIPVPRLYDVIKSKDEAKNFDFASLPSSFVVKPNFGYGGEGIIPVIGRKEGKWLQSNGEPLSNEDITKHVIDIIDGQFSLSNVRDTAFFEQLIIPDDILAQYSFKGLPDIRIIVHNLIPVMAMLRLPTQESGGKANLHLGAAGVGIDIAKGEATYTVYKNKIVEEIPGKGKIRGLKIPFWDEILFIASKTQLITNLGYMAVDIAIDKNSGPIILEINARAGLGVQIANLAPLRTRLEKIKGIKVNTPTKGVRVAKDLFGNIIEKEISHITGKKVIGVEENISLILKDQSFKIKAKIDTGATRSTIDRECAEKIGLLTPSNGFDKEKNLVKVKISINSTRIQTILDIKEIPTIENATKPKIILGSRDLKNFIIDPNKALNKVSLPDSKEKYDPKNYSVAQFRKKSNYSEIDQKLYEINRKIKVTKLIKPINLEEERLKFLQNQNYNPKFQYPPLNFDSYQIYRELDEIEIDATPTGKLFQGKKEEIEKKIALLEQRGNPLFTEISCDLFGKPTTAEYEEAKSGLSKMKSNNVYQHNNENETISAEEAAEIFNQVFTSYNLPEWKAVVRETMVADCNAGKKSKILIRKNAKFSPERIKNLTIHEIETHVLTSENGKHQPFKLFNSGFGHYLLTQEGLATYNVEKNGYEKKINNFRSLVGLTCSGLLFNHSFSEIVEILRSFGISNEEGFNWATKVKRGLEDTSAHGGFTKGYIYSAGKKQISEFIQQGGDLKDLYYGKYNLKDLDLIKQLPNLAPPKILPKWLN